VLAGDVEELIMDDIGRLEPGSNPRVQPQLHHAPEPLAMLVEERCQRAADVAAEVRESDRSSRRASCPRRIPYTLSAGCSECRTKKEEGCIRRADALASPKPVPACWI
jgi:hypothetical protein